MDRHGAEFRRRARFDVGGARTVDAGTPDHGRLGDGRGRSAEAAEERGRETGVESLARLAVSPSSARRAPRCEPTTINQRRREGSGMAGVGRKRSIVVSSCMILAMTIGVVP